MTHRKPNPIARRRGWLRGPLTLLLVGLAACGGTSTAPSSTVDSGEATSSTSSTAITTPTTPPDPPDALDCVADSATCPELTVVGDPPFTLPDGSASPFHGIADPSIRFDPDTGRLWLAYSWPHLHFEGGGRFAIGVESHLAHSDDGGASWMFDAVLWPSIPSTAPDGTSGYEDHEVPNLLPAIHGDATVWYGARLDYFVAADGQSARSWTPSFRIAITAADSPLALADAAPVYLGSAGTDAAWGVDVDLSALDPTVGTCALWNEPALYHDGESLYLVLRCLRFPPGSLDPDLRRSDLVVFDTPAEGAPQTWVWSFTGTLSGADEAAELGGEGLTQVDIALGQDGALLAIVSPDAWDTERSDFIHYGCRVVEVASMNPPALSRDADGSLALRATTDATDTYPLGPAACAYDPASATGLLMTRRVKTPGELIASIHSTFLFL